MDFSVESHSIFFFRKMGHDEIIFTKRHNFLNAWVPRSGDGQENTFSFDLVSARADNTDFI